jgi:hypothetical protein
MKQYLAALDRAAAQVNALLAVLAIGLAILDTTVLVGKSLVAAIAEDIPSAQTQISGSGDPFASSQPANPPATRP